MKTSTNQPKIPTRFPTERSDKALFFRRFLVDLQIHHVITFSGCLDKALIAKAVRLSLDAEPILGCRYVEHWWQPYWLRRDDLDFLDLCTTVEPDDLDQAILDYLTVPLDPRKDPLIQIMMFRSKWDTICIKANHVVVDAAGLMEYSQLLATIYRNLKADPNFKPTVNLEGSRNIKQILVNFNILSRIKMIRRGYRNLIRDCFPRENWQFPIHISGLPKKKTFILRKIPTNQFMALKLYCKENEATVNQIMVTAFYRALEKIINPPPNTPLRLGATVNLRRYLTNSKGQAICNLSGFMHLNIGSEIEKKFAETLGRVKKNFTDLNNDYLGLGVTRFNLFGYKMLPFFLAKTICAAYSRCSRILNPKGVAPWLTNLGRIDEKLLDFGKEKITDSFLTAPPTNPPVFAVAFSGFNKTITLSIGISEPYIDRKEVGLLLDYVEEELSQLRTGKTKKL